jgi:hypothetical protein
LIKGVASDRERHEVNAPALLKIESIYVLGVVIRSEPKVDTELGAKVCNEELRRAGPYIISGLYGPQALLLGGVGQLIASHVRVNAMPYSIVVADQSMYGAAFCLYLNE